MNSFLDRQYGRTYEPPKQASSSSRFAQPEEVIGTLAGRQEHDLAYLVLGRLRKGTKETRQRMAKFYLVLYGPKFVRILIDMLRRK